MPPGRNFKVTVLLARREKVQDDFHADEGGTRFSVVLPITVRPDTAVGA